MSEEKVVSEINITQIADLLEHDAYIIPSIDAPKRGAIIYVSFETYKEICKRASSVRPQKTTPSDGN